ncbi:hypothetical protein [Dictyobacter formicarum]|uniref:Uncharacterized protein n=1 Tax=Dictyobacter formicarum TaxID=2778368 RepID=A0ABQ3VQD7_9CHLR|nr:hypothetical protein [Dictyobacter formicarum]GHO88345.1 hypothetical protein KSZ_63510 [Dictyobacter formicarum]
MEQNRQQESTVDSKHVANERDLAGAGGGNIPCKASSFPSNQQSGASEEEMVGRGVDNDTDTAPKQHTEPGTHAAPGATSASDQPEQGALGGRTPAQASQSIGDMDHLREHSGIENTPVDPMTSRAPDKVNQKQKQDQKDKQDHE